MKKKTKLIILSVVLILLAVLLIPFKVDILEDGGSKVYSDVLYKYVKWVGFQKSEQTGVYETETIKKSVYDMLPPSRTLKYKTYLGVFLCPKEVRLSQY